MLFPGPRYGGLKRRKQAGVPGELGERVRFLPRHGVEVLEHLRVCVLGGDRRLAGTGGGR